MLYDIVTSIGDFISSPIGQIVLWGAATMSAFLYALIHWTGSPITDYSAQYRIVATGFILIFWMINILSWWSSTVHWMLFTDTFFVTLAIFIYKKSQLRWSYYLAILYLMSVGLDLMYWQGLSQSVYAILSNLVYVFQLLIVSGILTRKKILDLIPAQYQIYVTSKR